MAKEDENQHLGSNRGGRLTSWIKQRRERDILNQTGQGKQHHESNRWGSQHYESNRGRRLINCIKQRREINIILQIQEEDQHLWSSRGKSTSQINQKKGEGKSLLAVWTMKSLVPVHLMQLKRHSSIARAHNQKFLRKPFSLRFLPLSNSMI